jgi:HlyD family secretion protein
MTSRRLWLRLALLAALVAVVVLLRLTVFAPDPVSVRTVAAEKGRVEETITNSRAGTVKARRRAKLAPETGGRVLELPRRRGARVRKGDLLLRVDDALQRAHCASPDGGRPPWRDQACLAAERARRDRDRTAKLSADGLVSPRSSTRGGEASAAGRVPRRRTAAERAESAMAGSGHVEDSLPPSTDRGRHVHRGRRWTTPSPPAIPVPPVADLIDTRSIYVSAPMDEVDSARIKKGQPARLTVDSHPGRHFAARVVEVAPYVADRLEQNRTVEIELELDDAAVATSLLPGTSADAEVILSAREGAMRVPTSALLEGGKVLVLEGGRLVERTLQLGLRNWDFTEVTSGLAEGAVVVPGPPRSWPGRRPARPRPHVASGRGHPMIRLDGISRTFDVGGEPVHALVDVHEEIAAGEHLAIMGPSGSGKSTLLHILGCLDRPDRGVYELVGRDVARLMGPSSASSAARSASSSVLPSVPLITALERQAADGLRGYRPSAPRSRVGAAWGGARAGLPPTSFRRAPAGRHHTHRPRPQAPPADRPGTSCRCATCSDARADERRRPR